MLFKLLIPLLAIAAVYLLGRSHAVRRGEEALRQGRMDRTGSPPPALPAPEGGEVLPLGVRIKWAIYASAIAVTLSVGWFVYSQYAAGREVVTVTVVNIQSGDQSTYQARAQEVFARSFTTLEGKRITLADLERMEVTEPRE